MDSLDAIILGIVQGLTEFLPVSSSGHLELGKALLGDNSLPQESLLFTVVVHFATALSTIVIYRKDIVEIISGLLQFKNNEAFRFSLKIVISMIPAALVGVFLEEELESLFSGNIVFVGAMLIVTAALLAFADKAKNTGKPVTYKNALVIGIAQAVAVLPGISRSGATISTSVLLGNDKGKAARFSFLMVVPLIFGKIGKDILDGALSSETSQTLPLILGFGAAFLSGLVACNWMIRLVRNSKLTGFAIYCLVVGIGSIVIGLWI
ncbi:undecaprenyl-diphosphate phosphatase [Aureitalea marina]|uniref:Undecaprenyl-diphosphatase n=1 Tax=Aureitalea marina TaxID=930804 RepID=A0A2S7KT76_9FLAO|nr:undecaprenyl-diphosphate phosphatase [Aureitalea marina]PQB05816.1 UDP-diphosphatase [Aureitalea marina]